MSPSPKVVCSRKRRVEPADEIRLVRASRPELPRLDGEHRLAADGGEACGVHAGPSPECCRHVVDGCRPGRPGANLETASVVLDADGVDERSVRGRPGHEREHDQGEHRERRSGAEPRGQGIRDRHPQNWCERADAAEDPHDERKQRRGVVNHDEHCADDDHQPGDDPGREVHRERAEDGVPEVPGKQQRHDERASARRVRDALRHARDLQERDEAEQDERDAEHDGRRGTRARPGQREREAEQDRDRSQYESAPPPTGRRLGKVPDRRRDVHHAHAPRGDGDDDQGQEHPEREGDDEAAGVGRELDLQALVSVRRGEGARHHGDHAEGDERSQERADERGQQVVGDSFEGEHLHEMSTPRADRACDAELAPPLGGEHHEDEEDQEDARGDGERPERREERHEGVTGSVGVLDCVRLEGLDLESQLLGHGREERDDLSREASPGDVPSSIRDCDDLDLAFAVEQLLRLAERDEHGCVGRAGTIEPDDIPHARGDRSSAGVDGDSISALDAELPRGFRVEEDLACAQICERQRVAAGADDGREPVHPVGVAREEDDARLALALGRRLDGDLLHDRTGDAVDEAGACRRRLDARNGRLVDPAGAGRRPECTRDVVDCALRRDRLVRRAERCDGRRPDRVAHRVARGQSGGDDRGAEHQPEHDEGAAPAPAPDAPHGELDEDAVPDPEGCQGGERDPSPTRRTTRSVSAGMPKTSFIGYATRTPAVSAKATS